jgi:hypothetical protein
MSRATVSFADNEPLIKLSDDREDTKKNKCMYGFCLITSYAMFYGLGFYCGYIMGKNNNELDGSFNF